MDESGAKHILLVEDEFHIALAMASTLEKLGYRVLTSASGEEAIETAREKPAIDLVLMDVDLGPGMDGTEAAQIVIGVRNVPVVFLSSHTDPEIVGKTRKIASYGYVVKNTGPAVLDASIRMALKLFEAHEKLTKSEQKFRSFFEQAAVGVAEVDARTGRFLTVNNRLCDIMGHGADELQGFVFNDLVHPEEKKRDLKKRSKVTHYELEELARERRYLHKNGSTVWANTAVAALPAVGKGPASYLVVFEDVSARVGMEQSLRDHEERLRDDLTERMKAERALHKAEEQYRTLAEDMPAFITSFLADGTITYVNRALADHAGRSQSEMIGMNVFDFMPADVRTMVKERLGSLTADSPVERHEQFEKSGHGGALYQQWTNRGYFDERGSITHFQAIGYDITEHKLAAEKLRRSEALLNATQRLSGVGGWEWDTVCKAMYWTEETYRIHGLDSASIGEGSTAHIEKSVECYDVDDRPVILDAFQRCTGEAVAYDLEFPFTAMDGARKWIRTSGMPVVKENRVVKVAGTIMDITGRKRIERDLEGALEEKAALLRELQHRVKNTFAMISSLIQIESGRAGSGAVRTVLEDLLGRIGSLNELYAMLQPSGETARVALDEYYRRVIASLGRMYLSGSRGVAITNRISPVQVNVKSATSAGLILNELLTNALKYAFPGGRAGTVEVTLENRGADFELTVSDDGVGMHEGFDPGAHTGLGFTIIRMLVKQLAGSFTFERGAKTEFRVKVPID